jgi:hypothetical protein
LLFHDLRRSANRNMRDAGLPQPVRMNIMGHKTASMDRRYGIVDLTGIQIARELLARKAEKSSSKTVPDTARGRFDTSTSLGGLPEEPLSGWHLVRDTKLVSDRGETRVGRP